MKQYHLRSISQKLGYTFQNPTLLIIALTHRSISKAHNERLEFLGDSVLNTIISMALFKQYPDATEGSLSHMRSILVCEKQLAQLADHLDLKKYLQLAYSLTKQGGSMRSSLLANALEAIIGAIYLDCERQLLHCETYVLKWYQPYLNQLIDIGTQPPKDPKTALQEYLQARKLPLPYYHLVKQTGTGHEPIFAITCALQHPTDTSKPIQHTSTGKTRRQAEQAAAALVLEALQMLESVSSSK